MGWAHSFAEKVYNTIGIDVRIFFFFSLEDSGSNRLATWEVDNPHKTPKPLCTTDFSKNPAKSY